MYASLNSTAVPFPRPLPRAPRRSVRTTAIHTPHVYNPKIAGKEAGKRLRSLFFQSNQRVIGVSTENPEFVWPMVATLLRSFCDLPHATPPLVLVIKSEADANTPPKPGNAEYLHLLLEADAPPLYVPGRRSAQWTLLRLPQDRAQVDRLTALPSAVLAVVLDPSPEATSLALGELSWLFFKLGRESGATCKIVVASSSGRPQEACPYHLDQFIAERNWSRNFIAGINAAPSSSSRPPAQADQRPPQTGPQPIASTSYSTRARSPSPRPASPQTQDDPWPQDSWSEPHLIEDFDPGFASFDRTEIVRPGPAAFDPALKSISKLLPLRVAAGARTDVEQDLTEADKNKLETILIDWDGPELPRLSVFWLGTRRGEGSFYAFRDADVGLWGVLSSVETAEDMDKMVSEHLASGEASPLLHTTPDCELTFEEEADVSVGSWRFFRLLVIGEVGWGQADTLWPNAALQSDRVAFNLRSVADLVRFLGDATQEGVATHIENLIRIQRERAYAQRWVFVQLKKRWGEKALRKPDILAKLRKENESKEALKDAFRLELEEDDWLD